MFCEVSTLVYIESAPTKHSKMADLKQNTKTYKKKRYLFIYLFDFGFVALIINCSSKYLLTVLMCGNANM